MKRGVPDTVVAMTPLELYVELIDRYGVPQWITNSRGQHLKLRDVLALVGDGEAGIIRAEAYSDGYDDGFHAGHDVGYADGLADGQAS